MLYPKDSPSLLKRFEDFTKVWLFKVQLDLVKLNQSPFIFGDIKFFLSSQMKGGSQDNEKCVITQLILNYFPKTGTG